MKLKLSKKASSAIGCLWIAADLLLIILQIVFLTMKISGAVSWSWWATLIPVFCIIVLPIAVVMIAVIVLAPKAIIEDRRRRKRVEAEAKKYGMERNPGESTGELKKRIVQRNMIAGNYSRKEIKDEILRTFPNVGSCQILINNQTLEIVLNLRGWNPLNYEGDTLTDNELREIAEFAAQYIPMKYTITAKNAKNEEETNGNTES